jgi:hypothetical protein
MNRRLHQSKVDASVTATAIPSVGMAKRSLFGLQFSTWTFLLPALLFFVGYQVFPIIRVVWLSFTDFKYLTNDPANWVGLAWARDMLLTGRIVNAKEALSIGLVNRVTEGPGQLADSVAELVAQITGGSPLGARYAKEAVGKGMDLSLDQGLGLEADLNVILQSTADRAEGIKSFLEKRGPEFKGS